MLGSPLAVLEERKIPIHAAGESMTDIEIGIAVVESGIEGIQQSQVEVSIRLTERRAQIVSGHCIRVSSRELETLQVEAAMFTEVAALERCGKCVVSGRTSIAATVNVAVLAVESIDGATDCCRTRGPAAEVGGTKANSVKVLEAVKFHASRSVKRRREHCSLPQLMFEGRSVNVRVSRRDVMSHVEQAHD